MYRDVQLGDLAVEAKTENMLLATEMNFWRRAARRNETIKEMMRVQNTLVNDITRQLIGTDMFRECWRKDFHGKSPNGSPMVEEGEDAQGKAGLEEWTEYTERSVVGPKKMEGGHRKVTIV